MVEVDIPDVLAELTAAFEQYERALVTNDVETLNSLFWNSPLTLRYGATELLYSYDEIVEFRKNRVVLDARRTLRNTRITTFGRDVGTANTEFTRRGSDRIGRQSQTWIRTDQGWRIASAHVSLM